MINGLLNSKHLPDIDRRPIDSPISRSSEGENEKATVVEHGDLARVESLYLIFTKPKKLGIVSLVAYTSVFSPLSSFIYYPALVAVADALHTDLSKINLTVTSYMVVSGVVPMILGSLADQVGRRPVYLLMFLLYVLANVGLALQSSYPVLLVLRMIQSAGGSATIGLGYGVVGDITESSDRGAYMGIFGIGAHVVPGIGPIIGGFFAREAGWHWIFGFLAISGALSLLLIAVILPETARNIVCNGSHPVSWLNQSLWMFWQRKKETKVTMSRAKHKESSDNSLRRTKLKIPNPMESISIFLCKDTAPVVLVNAVTYAAMTCLQASLSSLFITIYGYQELEAGLIYLPFGVGCFLATLLSCESNVRYASSEFLRISTDDC